MDFYKTLLEQHLFLKYLIKIYFIKILIEYKNIKN
jgi:hypothetical protein